MNITHQRKTWEDQFGADYIMRNIYTPNELDIFYKNIYNHTRTEMNELFLNTIPKNSRILEVGTNVGNQLLLLQRMGFTNLYGIEIQQRAVDFSKSRTSGLNIVRGDALDIPFKDNYFDLVFTSGVLIHISPENIDQALNEMYRVSNKYIWGHEYFAENYTEIEYQGQKNLLWKTNFCKLFLDKFPNLKELKQKKYKYINDAKLEDQMYLLVKDTK